MAKILVLDDREANRELIVAVLRNSGHEILQASDGLEALAIAREKHPRLVLSDILMPNMDGYEFARQLRADPDVAGTEIVFCTAHYRTREARKLAEDCGAFAVLAKPFEPEELLKVVHDALHAGRVARPKPTVQVSREHLRVMADKLAEQADRLRALRQRVADLYELNLEFASELDPRAQIASFCRGARDLTGAKYAIVAIKVPAGQGAEGVLVQVSGLEASRVAKLKLASIAYGGLGQVVLERRSRRFVGAAANPESMGLPKGFPRIHFAIAAPIVSVADVYGWVCLADKSSATDFDDEDELFLTKLAAQAGRVYEKRVTAADTLAEVQKLRAEVDRRRETARTSATLAELLSNNEREIVRRVAEGHATTDIAEALGLSPRTVETYRARLMHKLGLEDLPSLIKFAIRSGIATLD